MHHQRVIIARAALVRLIHQRRYRLQRQLLPFQRHPAYFIRKPRKHHVCIARLMVIRRHARHLVVLLQVIVVLLLVRNFAFRRIASVDGSV